jgi:hypothetical protein
MLTRRLAIALTLVLCVAGCAGNSPSATGSSASSASSVPASSAPASSASASASPSPSVEPSTGGAQTVTGTVEAGVEANCRLIKDGTGSHLLYFDDPSLKASAAVGKKVTVTGRSEPGMMTTCQQGVPFVVTSVSPA